MPTGICPDGEFRPLLHEPSFTTISKTITDLNPVNISQTNNCCTILTKCSVSISSTRRVTAIYGGSLQHTIQINVNHSRCSNSPVKCPLLPDILRHQVGSNFIPGYPIINKQSITCPSHTESISGI